MSKQVFQIRPDAEEAPEIRMVNRRRFLKLGIGGAAAVGLAAGGVSLVRYFSGEEPKRPPGSTLVRLSEMPNENPAFQARALPDGGLVVWTERKAGEPLAYSLNANARLVWRLCDGRRTEKEILDLYHEETGRDASEAKQSLAALLKESIVVEGGYIVVGPDFPVGETTNARYLRRVSDEEMAIR